MKSLKGQAKAFFLTCCLAMAVLAQGLVTAAAGEAQPQTGSLTFEIKDGNTPWEGVKLSLYRVTDGATYTDGTGGSLTGKFADFHYTLSVASESDPTRQDPDATELLKRRLYYYVGESKSIAADAEAVSDAQGMAYFENVGEGLYYILPSDYEAYGVASDCLVWVPTVDEEGTTIYDIVLEPKVEPTTAPETTSEEETSSEEETTAPEETTVPEETTTAPAETTAPEVTTAPTTTAPATTTTAPQITTAPSTSPEKILGIIDISGPMGKIMITAGIVLLAAALVILAVRAFRNENRR